MTENDFAEVTVKEATHEDAGKGIARVSVEVMKKLALVSGDIIEIQGKRKPLLLSGQAFSTIPATLFFSIDGNIRGNLNTGIDEKVRIKKSTAEYARKVVIQPTQPIRLVGGEQYLSRLLRGRAVFEGQTQRIDVIGNSITLIIAKVLPKGIAIVTDTTEIELKEEPYNPEEGKTEVSDIHYEDIGGLEWELQLVREMIDSHCVIRKFLKDWELNPQKAFYSLVLPGLVKP